MPSFFAGNELKGRGNRMCHNANLFQQNIIFGRTHPILILDDILPYGGQGRPFTVVSGSDGAAFVSFEFAH